jgi:thioredoxin-like negative regulator of GroEL
VDPKAAEQMEKELDHLALQFAKWDRPNEISSTALRAASTVDQLAQQIRTQRYDPDLTARIMLKIVGNGETIANSGERTAEQATMAIDSLFIAYTANTKLPNEAELRAAIKPLFSQLQNPSAYNAVQFRAQLLKVQALLPHSSQAANRLR